MNKQHRCDSVTANSFWTWEWGTCGGPGKKRIHGGADIWARSVESGRHCLKSGTTFFLQMGSYCNCNLRGWESLWYRGKQTNKNVELG